MTTTIEVVDVTIDIRDAAVAQQGFGTPMIVASHAFWPETVRTFSELAQLVTPPLAVPTSHPVYLMAQAMKAQKPSPATFKVGKRAGLGTQVAKLTPTVDPAGSSYAFRIKTKDLTATVAAAGTVAMACTAIAAAITGATPPLGVTAVATATEITVTSTTPGTRFSFSCSSKNIAYLETTPDPTIGIATDLNTIRAYDQDWYGLVIDATGPAEILGAANWAETNTVMFWPTTMDSDAIGSGSTDIGTQLKAASITRTFTTWHHRAAEQYAGAAWLGKMLPKDPGAANWANKALALVDMSPLDDTARGNLRNKNVNYYVAIKGVGFTLDGRAASGRFADITQGTDWFESRLEERIVGLLANNDKVPYTDKGIALIRSQVEAQILEAITATIADGDQDWWTSAPAVADVAPADKIARILRNVKFQFVLQGAINKVLINGTVLVAAA